MLMCHRRISANQLSGQNISFLKNEKNELPANTPRIFDDILLQGCRN